MIGVSEKDAPQNPSLAQKPILFNHQLQKNNIETGRGCWAALPESRRTMRRVFSQNLAAAPLEVGYMRI